MSETYEKIPTDLKHYLDQPTIPLSENILQFWNTHRPIYPFLSKIIEPYLTIVVTSVPSERLFSKAGNIMTENRNRLTGENLHKLLFLNSLPFPDWHL